MQASIKNLTPLFRLVILLFAVFFCSRILLLIWQSQRFLIDNLWLILSGGIRVDLSSIGYLALPAILILFVHSLIKLKITQQLFTVYSVVIITLVVVFESATPAFILQYDIRPNRLFVEYLNYPKEVFSMLLTGHLLTLIISLLITTITTYFSYQFISKAFANNLQSKKTTNSMMLFFCLLLSVISARGTVGHRPLNPALVYFSQDTLVNSLILNSSYSVAFAIKNMANEKSANALYGNLPRQDIIDTVQQAMLDKTLVSDAIPTLAINQPYGQFSNKNLVIILEESLGARFVGQLGGINITPELDRLYQQGWGFNHMYATGTRSVRGIEAVTTGFIPSPSRAIVKLSKSQKNFFSIASLLNQHDYTTQFIYGGESHFDNMKSFFLGNGFTDIVDIKDIKNPAFVSSWGVSDEDLFQQANQELIALHKQQQPFFSLIFTSSNHDPFKIPADKVTLPKGHDAEHYARDLAIKYADFALGKFIKTAKQQDYWQNTIFMVVADHDVRVFGSEPVPIKSFHIPAVILNSDIGHKEDDRLVSQLDLPVTLMSLLGIKQATPMIGFDLTKTYPIERAMMQYYDNFAYIENEQAVILMPNKKVSFWHYDVSTKNQSPLMQNQQNKALAHKALAHVLYSNLAYTEYLYRLP